MQDATAIIDAINSQLDVLAVELGYSGTATGRVMKVDDLVNDLSIALGVTA